MSKKSAQVALGGIFSSLCLVLMFMTGLFPFATYAIPALAGAMLIAVVVEMGAKTALMVYVSVSALSALIIADKEAALMFIFFFGYYPIVKEKLEGLASRVLEAFIKLLIFNASVAGAYMLVIHALGYSEVLEEFAEFGKYGALIMLGLGNIVFLLYDIALTRYISLYVHRLRRRLLRKG